MYEDNDLWPVKCTHCGQEFTKKIGWLKTQKPKISLKCPGIVSKLGPVLCPNTLVYGAEEFRVVLAEAKAGRFDPWRSIICVNKLF